MHYFCNVFICSMVVELGAPKPTTILFCISISYLIYKFMIPHKNNTDERFGPDFMMMGLIYSTFGGNCKAKSVLAYPSLPLPCFPILCSLRISCFANQSIAQSYDWLQAWYQIGILSKTDRGDRKKHLPSIPCAGYYFLKASIHTKWILIQASYPILS